MARNWTDAQKAAMQVEGRTVLVSAAAGSGKTATLTERIIRQLTEQERPLSRLLIVTFTRAAAAELRDRIGGALRAALEADPSNQFLQKQLIALPGAHISTIDAFVREPVAAHFAELGLPAGMRLADEAELAPLQERVMGEVIDDLYLKYAGEQTDDPFSLLSKNPFADLCDALTSSKNDEALIPTLLALYKRLLSFPSELSRLTSEAERLEAQATGEFFESDHGRILQEWLGDFCSYATERLETALVDIESQAAAEKAYGQAFRADLDFCRNLADTEGYTATRELLLSYKNERLGALRGADEVMVGHKQARADIVAAIKDIRDDYFREESPSLSLQMRRTAVMCRVLYDLLSEYDRRVMKEKQERGLSDFTDNRRYLLRLLRGEGGEPSPLALQLRAQYDEVYIDEYQDVDEMQDEIFRLVGGEHRFMVGDIKQSIYGFRGADPTVFAGYRRRLPALSEAGEDACGVSIFMSDNFRCDESVIRVTNAVCGHILRAATQSVGYTADDDLRHGKALPRENYVSPAVEVTVLTKPSKEEAADLTAEALEGGDPLLAGTTAEATYVANRIAEMLEGGEALADGSPIRPRDIVILMRSKAALSGYLTALSARGIPVGSEELDAMEAGRDLLRGADMVYLVNLLRVLDDPDSDVPLSEILRAPFPGFDLEELLTLRRVGDREASALSLYACLESYASTGEEDDLRERVASFIAWIEKYRLLTATRPAVGLLRLLRRDKNCAARHTEAFRHLYEAARVFRASTFVSLHAFLRYFERHLTVTKNISTDHAQGDGDGYVSIMTIHKSKGLEFPVCFLVGCGQHFSISSQTPDLIFEPRAGVAMKLYHRDETAKAKVDTTLRALAALSTKLSEREEEMRILYVAMTRARERLCLVGGGKAGTHAFPEGDRFAALSAGCYLSWILAGVESHPELNDHVQVQYISTADILPGQRLARRASARTAADGEYDATAEHYRALCHSRSPLSETDLLLRRIPTKVPASRMTPTMLDSCIFWETDWQAGGGDGKLPQADAGESFCDARSLEAIRESLSLMATGGAEEFELLLAENRRPTATERGTATHLFLQFCDYRRVTEGGLEAEIYRLIEEGYINQRTGDMLDRARLTAFFSSDFFNLIRTATRVEREHRFQRFIPLPSLTANAALATALEGRTLYVQGSIDLVLHFADGHIEICDYKTDFVTKDEVANPTLLRTRLWERHGEQLLQYAAAIEEMYGRRPDALHIYALAAGTAVTFTGV